MNAQLPQIIIDALLAGSVYAVAAAGLALTYRVLGVFNFAHGHLMMLGAYLFYLAYVGFHLSFGVSAFVVLCAAVPISWTFFRGVLEPFSSANPILPFVTTMAASVIIEALISILFGVNVLTVSAGTIEASTPIFGGAFLSPDRLFFALASLAVCLLVVYFVRGTTPAGRRINAVSTHEFGALSLGIEAKRIRWAIFLTSVALAFWGGIVSAFESNLSPLMGVSYSLKSFAAMILGGVGSIRGAIVAAYLLSFGENLLLGLNTGEFALPVSYKDSLSFLVILLVLLLRPRGIWGPVHSRRV